MLIPNGISYVRKSITLSTRSAEANNAYQMLVHVNPQTAKTSTYNAAFNASMTGYCAEIFVLHLRHLPRSASQLNTGIMSYQLS